MAVAEKIRPITSDSSVTSEIMTITPKIAEEMLGLNLRNRHVSSGLVKAYARDMKERDWRLTGESIKFDTRGHLLDGQHRLLACIEAKKSFKTIVLRGLDEESQEVMDTGRARNASDALSLQGLQCAVRTIAAVRNLVFLKNGNVTMKVTAGECLRLFAKHPGVNHSAIRVQQAYGPNGAFLAAIHYAGSYLMDKQDHAEAFVDVFITGNSREECPAHVWRERLVRMKAAHARISRAAMFYGTIHAWNLFVAGEDLKQIKIPETAKIVGLNLDLI